MEDDGRSWRKWGYLFVMIGCAQFVLLTFLAMLYYPGGTHADAATRGYSFFKNFFSSLGLTKTPSGEGNFASFLLFTIALSLAGLALVVFFTTFPEFFRGSKTTRTLSFLGSIFGVTSGFGFIGVAFTPADLYGEPHERFVQIAFIAFLIAVLPYIVAIGMTEAYSNRYAWVFMGYALILSAYLWLIFWGPTLETEPGLVVQATGQKIVSYAALGSMFFQSWGAWNLKRKIAP